MTQAITKADFEDWQRNKVTKEILDVIQKMFDEEEHFLDTSKFHVRLTSDSQIEQAKVIGRMEAYSSLLDISYEDDLEVQDEEVQEDYFND